MPSVAGHLHNRVRWMTDPAPPRHPTRPTRPASINHTTHFASMRSPWYPQVNVHSTWIVLIFYSFLLLFCLLAGSTIRPDKRNPFFYLLLSTSRTHIHSIYYSKIALFYGVHILFSNHIRLSSVPSPLQIDLLVCAIYSLLMPCFALNAHQTNIKCP